MPEPENTPLQNTTPKHADTGTAVRAEQPDNDEVTRQGEAGSTYTGREMSDDLKANPRIRDASRVRPQDKLRPEAEAEDEAQDEP